MAKISLKNCTLKIQDATAVTPLSITLKFGDGNFTWSEKRNREYVRDRGILDTVRDGDDEPVDVKFEGVLEYYTGPSGAPTPEDALTKTGDASAWVSTGATCEPYAVDLILTNTPQCTGTALKETYTFADFRHESIDYDVKAGTISVTGKCNITKPSTVRANI